MIYCSNEGERAFAAFTHFDLEPPTLGQCLSDYVEVYDSNAEGLEGKILYSGCGQITDKFWKGFGNTQYLLVILTSNPYLTFR